MKRAYRQISIVPLHHGQRGIAGLVRTPAGGHRIEIGFEQKENPAAENHMIGETPADILDALPQLILVCDCAGRIGIANRTAHTMLGNDIVGADCTAVLRRASIHRPCGSFLKENEMPASRVLQGEPVSDERVVLTDCNGVDHCMSVSATPLFADSAIAGTIISCQELDDPGTPWSAAARENSRDFRIFKTAPVGIALCNTEGRSLGMNPACRALLKARSVVSPEEYNFFHDTAISDSEKERIKEGRVIRCTIPIGGSMPLPEKDSCSVVPAQVRYLDLRIIPIRGEAGNIDGYAIWLQDATGYSGAKEAHQMAFEQINRNIEQFAVLGDHIRQPLQVIQGIAGFMEGDDAKIIQHETREINGILQQLDRGWVESRKVREFLKRNEKS